MLPSKEGLPVVSSNSKWIHPGGTSVKMEERDWVRAVESAEYASSDRNGDFLCLVRGDHRLQRWDLGADRVIQEWKTQRIDDLQAVPSGCLALAGGKALLFDRPGSSKELGSDAGAIAVFEGEMAMAAGSKILVFDSRGELKSEHDAVSGITALLKDKGKFIVGREDGTIELVPAKPGESSFQDAPAAPVLRMMKGPMETLIAGYKSGFVGIWDIQDGALLDHAWLHGPVKHMMLKDQKLYAATILGDHLSMDLGVFYADYCDLMRKIWKKVPVVWEGGRPVERQPPDDHQCLAGR